MSSQQPIRPAPIKAVFWDFGGVILTSPFDAFNRFEAERGLPKDFIRGVNARNPHTNAWAKLERSEVDPAGFAALFEEESAALGHRLSGHEVLARISGDVRPEMVTALRKVKARYRIACLTNNAKVGEGPGMTRNVQRAAQIAEIMTLFDAVIESSKVGIRKPEPRFYEIACETLGVRPTETVFLDDLGINLKPAAAMGMRTIKVTGPAQALAELEAVLGHPL
ncbi:HAD-IA family hydrolase [Desertibaculum subflavum]|uniref:HAD-IA family hydrolase n=1 Tax=Desertibaculum subflavum TaxID=2268458 RepID=UPI000E6613A7